MLQSRYLLVPHLPSLPVGLPLEDRPEVYPDSAVRRVHLLPGEGDAVVQPGQEDAVAVGDAGRQHRVEHGATATATAGDRMGRTGRRGGVFYLRKKQCVRITFKSSIASPSYPA